MTSIVDFEQENVSWVVVFQYLTLEHMQSNVQGIVVVFWPICSQYSLFLPPENIRKPYGFLMFLGSKERVH